MSIRAIVFDFDGVIADTERLHHESLAAVAEPLGVAMDYEHYLRHYVSFDDRDCMRALLAEVAGGAPLLEGAPELEAEQMAVLLAEKATAFERALERPVPTIPGVEKFLGQVPGEMPVAIATGSSRRDLTTVLARLGLGERFAVTVCADDVSRSKPDPQTYRRAVERLSAARPEMQLKPEQCLAIEDTPGGIESARGAGLRVLGLTTTCPADRLLRAHRLAADFRELSMAVLREWFG